MHNGGEWQVACGRNIYIVALLYCTLTPRSITSSYHTTSDGLTNLELSKIVNTKYGE